ncbi:serine protease [Microbacteriaceae bacterium K1510]|nr:serine protease [Microbacteriaceae bacterium K1510]
MSEADIRNRSKVVLTAWGGALSFVIFFIASLPAFVSAQSFLPMQEPLRPMQRLARTPENSVRAETTSTAFFVNGSGYMLTARHAVENCSRVIVAKEGWAVEAKVIAQSSEADVALVKAPRTLGLSAVFPRTVAVAASDMVFASAFDTLPGKLIGAGLMANAVVRSESTGDALAIESDVTFGASGAPVLDSRGLVQGVISRRTAANRVVAVGAHAVKSFLSAHNVRFEQDDRAQIAGNGSRAHRAASISARIRCLQN